MGTHPIFESDFDCLTECTNRAKMDNYLPGEEKVSSVPGSISKFCSNEDYFELFVSDESEVDETISLARSVLAEGKMVLIKSVSRFGVHAQVVGQIRKKKGIWVYTELELCSICTEWVPMESSFDKLEVNRSSQQLITLLSKQQIKFLKNLPTRNHILFGAKPTTGKPQMNKKK